MKREEALEIIRKNMPSDKSLPVYEAIQTLIPELTENEDERIRKCIGMALTDVKEQRFMDYGTSLKDCLSWLEKQKEQKTIFNIKQFGLNDFEEELFHLLRGMKYLNISDEEIALNVKNQIAPNLLELIQKEQKSIGWSEEDERKLEKCIKIVERWEEDYDIAYAPYSNMLKSLHTQPKPEWNDEDEKNLQARFAFYTYNDDPCTLYLSNVFVEETSRNKGFGTKILTSAEKVAETFGATYIRLKVKQDNPAHAWYQKHGYNYITSEGDYDWFEKTLEYSKPVKQEWSEADRLHYTNVLEALEYVKGCKSDYDKIEAVKSDIVWFKSLLERFNLKSIQEWNETDKAIINCIVLCLDGQFVSESARKQCLKWFNRHRRDFLNSTSCKSS